MTKLWNAAYFGSTDQLQNLLSKYHFDKSQIEWKNSSYSGNTPLHIASSFGHTSCVELLLKAGTNVNCINDARSTPLNKASTYNNTSVVSALLAAGADIDMADNNDYTPLMNAAYFGHSATVKLLLDGGANTEIKTIFGNKALDFAIENKRNEVVTIIQEHRFKLVVCLVVVAYSHRSLPIELAEICGDFVAITPKRRALLKMDNN